jgi:hypothetical protein
MEDVQEKMLSRIREFQITGFMGFSRRLILKKIAQRFGNCLGFRNASVTDQTFSVSDVKVV